MAAKQFSSFDQKMKAYKVAHPNDVDQEVCLSNQVIADLVTLFMVFIKS